MKKRKKIHACLTTRGMILAVLLTTESAYGLEIIRECRLRTKGLFAPQQGCLYPALRQLQREKLVSAKVLARPPSVGGRSRVVYWLTARGDREAQEMREAIIDVVLPSRRTLDMSLKG